MPTDAQEAAKWNAAGAKRTAGDIAASRKKAAQMRQRADMTCTTCGSLLSAVTFTCVRGEYCGKPFKHSSTNCGQAPQFETVNQMTRNERKS